MTCSASYLLEQNSEIQDLSRSPGNSNSFRYSLAKLSQSETLIWQPWRITILVPVAFDSAP